MEIISKVVYEMDASDRVSGVMVKTQLRDMKFVP